MRFQGYLMRIYSTQHMRQCIFQNLFRIIEGIARIGTFFSTNTPSANSLIASCYDDNKTIYTEDILYMVCKYLNIPY
jgi:hypothetical protein